jgi:hypothetical protein
MICVLDCSNGWNKAKKALETYAAQTNDGSMGAISPLGEAQATKNGQVGGRRGE